MKQVQGFTTDGRVVLLDRGESLPDTEAVLQRIRLLVDFLDNRYTLPGTSFRFGWDGLIGLIPGIGDVVTTCIAGYVVYLARQLGVPKTVLWRMAANVCVDMGMGAIPFIGDLADVAWKANLKNLRLLERHLLNQTVSGRKAA